MKLRPGDPAPAFHATAMDGSDFNSALLRDRRWLVGFHRYAT